MLLSGHLAAESTLDQMQEAEAQFSELKAAVMAQGESADPWILERMHTLEAQLQDLKSSQAASIPSTCLVLSAKHAGIKKKGTRAALKQLSEWNHQLAEAETNELFCLVAVCMNELTEERQNLVRQGSLDSLLPEIVQKANSTACKGHVDGVEESVWLELKRIAIEMVLELEAVDDAGFYSSFRKNAWKLAMIPGTAAIFILRGYRMWRDESNKKKEKQEKEQQKKDSDSKKVK